MNRLKIFIALLLLFCNIPQSDCWAQNTISLLGRARDKVEQGSRKVVDQIFKEKQGEEPVQDANQQSASDGVKKSAYKSKFDFIPGEKVIYFYDFNDVAAGDIPEGWQIDGSAEVVEVEGFEGHYMMVQQQSAVLPETFDDLPDDLTIQFDLICTNPYTWGGSQLYFIMADTDPNKEIDSRGGNLGSANNHVLWLAFHPGSQSAVANKGYGSYEMVTKTGIKKGEYPAESFIDTNEGRLAKISIWKQKKRVRLYVNENKVLDLPTILPEGMTVNTFAWNVFSGYYNDEKYFIGNIRVAEGMPDTRKNLTANGKYVTTGILFDVNSDVIRPESYGVLKEIAGMLKSSPDIKVTIVGHTDSDGDDAKNLELSRSRAESVKKALVKDFSVDGSMLSTDGKGETEPAAENDTPQNKANNRRVEFIVNK
jgi:outer membrane protein OmpA-like peptidoglycan-associated protein